jgi:hypothetical protein
VPGEFSVQDVQQAYEVSAEPGVAQLDGLAAGERSQAGRELVRTGHPRAVHQHGDHSHAPGQRRLDLQPHEITRIIQPASVLPGGREPPAADHRQQHPARLDRLGDHLREVIARLYRAHVLEHPVSAETGSHLVETASPPDSRHPRAGPQNPRPSQTGFMTATSQRSRLLPADYVSSNSRTSSPRAARRTFSSCLLMLSACRTFITAYTSVRSAEMHRLFVAMTKIEDRLWAKAIVASPLIQLVSSFHPTAGWSRGRFLRRLILRNDFMASSKRQAK